MAIWIVWIILLCLLIYVSYGYIALRIEMKSVRHQLKDVADNFGTNELVQTKTHHPEFNQLIERMNDLILRYKQEQQAQSQREETLKKEITNISHDLRTPLTAVKGFLEILTDERLSESERKEAEKIISKRVDHLIHIVDLFYELSQINSGDKAENLEFISLNEKVSESLLLYYQAFAAKGIEVDIKESEPITVFMDEKSCQRVINNLIQNALDYAKTRLEINYESIEEYIILEVTNDIEADDIQDLEKIFTRTYRLDQGRSSDRLGLGLHIVEQLMAGQGGYVTADFVQNRFTIKLFFKK